MSSSSVAQSRHGFPPESSRVAPTAVPTRSEGRRRSIPLPIRRPRSRSSPPMARSSIVRAAIRLRSRSMRPTAPSRPEPPEPSTVRDVDIDGGNERLLTMAAGGDVAVQVSRSLTQTDDTLQTLTILFAIVGGVVIAVTVASGFALTRRSLRPIGRLTDRGRTDRPHAGPVHDDRRGRIRRGRAIVGGVQRHVDGIGGCSRTAASARGRRVARAADAADLVCGPTSRCCPVPRIATSSANWRPDR